MAKNCEKFDPEFAVGACLLPLEDKERLARDFVMHKLDELSTMFEYEGLPENVDPFVLDRNLFINGFTFFTDKKDGYGIYYGGLGGEPDRNYLPTIITISNPALRWSDTLSIKDDGVLIKNDSYLRGVLPMLKYWATLYTENSVSLNMVDIMTRLATLFTASTDDGKKSADLVIKDIVAGKLNIVAVDKAFTESMKALPYSHAGEINAIKALIEYHQYIKASCYNAIGLDANYNMKREAINSEEAGLNADALLPFVDDMLKCRAEAMEAINKKYGLNISVRLSGAWALRHELNHQMANDDPEPFDTEEPSEEVVEEPSEETIEEPVEETKEKSEPEEEEKKDEEA